MGYIRRHKEKESLAYYSMLAHILMHTQTGTDWCSWLERLRAHSEGHRSLQRRWQYSIRSMSHTDTLSRVCARALTHTRHMNVQTLPQVNACACVSCKHIKHVKCFEFIIALPFLPPSHGHSFSNVDQRKVDWEDSRSICQCVQVHIGSDLPARRRPR